MRFHRLDPITRRGIAREAQILAGVLKLCRYHPNVGLAWRQNTGAMEVEGRTVRFGFVGVSDILGVLKSGRFMALEVKTERGRLTGAQRAFIEAVRQAGGFAAVVRSVDEAKVALDMCVPERSEGRDSGSAAEDESYERQRREAQA